MRGCGNLEIRKFGNLGIWQFEDVEMGERVKV
jgi:hypothetical protein